MAGFLGDSLKRVVERIYTMKYNQIYVLHRGSLPDSEPAEVYHLEAFGDLGCGNMEDPSFAQRFNIIGMDEKTVIVQEKKKTVFRD